MKWVCIVALVGAALLTPSNWGARSMLNLIVCCGAVVIVNQAWRTSQWSWVVAFVAVALAFNPLEPLLPAYRTGHYLLLALTTLLYASSLFAFRGSPVLSIPSITDRTPGSESL